MALASKTGVFYWSDATQELIITFKNLSSRIGALNYSQRVMLWVAWLTLSAFVLHSQSHRPVGRSRLAVVFLPLVGNFLAPLLFHPVNDVCTNVVSSLVTTWMTSFKALGWMLNRGPLVRPLNALQFVAVYALPITPTIIQGVESGTDVTPGQHADDYQAKGQQDGVYRHGGRLSESAGGPGKNLRNFMAKILGIAVLLYLLLNFQLAGLVETFLFGMALYCFLGLIMDGPATLATSAIGLGIAPHFDNPYISASVTEFWNKRWNLTAGNTLRFLIYDPINEGRLVYDPKVSVARSRWRRLLGMSMVFVVSGVMHEVMFLCFGHRLSKRFFLFFASQIPIMAVETLARQALKKRGVAIPLFVAAPLTIFTVVWCADRFFFAPLHQDHVTQQFIQNVKEVSVSLGGTLMELERWWQAVDVAAPLLQQR